MGTLNLPFSGSFDTDGIVFEIVQPSSAGIAILGASYGTDPYGDAPIGVFGQTDAGIGVTAIASADGTGLEAGSNGAGLGIFGYSSGGTGIWGETSSPGNPAIVGISYATQNNVQAGVGVSGQGAYGMQAQGETGIQAIGSGIGVWAISDQSDAIFATTGSGTALHAHAVSGQAGYFQGDVNITGNLTKGGGGFKIDHPADPANKYLAHSFVESPDMKNIYDGVAVLNRRGEAEVKLPSYFEALNAGFRYQLTALGAPAPNLHVAKGVSRGAFRIAGGRPRMRVSWQVTGIRKDRWAQKHRLAVEEKKPSKHRGFFLHPELYAKPAKKHIAWARNPDHMRRIEGLAKARGKFKLPPRRKRTSHRAIAAGARP